MSSGPEGLEREPQALAAQWRRVAPEEEDAEEKTDEPATRPGNELVEAVAADRMNDADDAENSHGTRILRVRVARPHFFSWSKNFLRNLATFGSMTTLQYGFDPPTLA